MNYFVETLKALALRGAMSGFVQVSTRELGKEMGVSQQTASNRLVAMAEADLVRRRRGARGQEIMITKDGTGLLRKEYAEYARIFSEAQVMLIRGTVSSGLGEGQYYLNKPGYSDQIKEKLGFTPFKGTLNLRVAEADMSKLAMLLPDMGQRLEGFKADGRTYGEADCIPATIKGKGCAIILPRRSHHTGVLEIISEKHLRTELGLKDGDDVEIKIKQA